jgi:hypothetical protein
MRSLGPVRLRRAAVANMAPVMDLERTALLVNLAATWAMVGVIWFVQIVHYPLYPLVGTDGFGRYERVHRMRTGVVVGPLMGAELLGAVLLVGLAPGAVSVGALVLLAAVLVVTFVVSVPCHERLERGFDAGVARRLVRSNWVRTAGWSLRGVLAVALVAEALS